MGYIVFRKGYGIWGAAKEAIGALTDARYFLRHGNDTRPIRIYSYVELEGDPYYQDMGKPEDAPFGAFVLDRATDRLIERINDPRGMGNGTQYYYNEELEMYDTRPC
jgi:hypothetical protein